MSEQSPHIEVRNLTMAYGDFVVMRDLNFRIERSRVTAIMGGSGCGKSTLLKHLIGLLQPASGEILIDGRPYRNGGGCRANLDLMRKFGVTYQQGALWSSLTLAENVAMPLQEYTELDKQDIRDLVSFKLALVGLAGFEDYYPSAISGGMRKRAGLARAIALDPEILFFDEPSAGLDPISSRRLDDLIIHLSQTLNTTIVIITHELSSLFSIADQAIFLDAEKRGITAIGNPNDLLKNPPNENVFAFLTRGESSIFSTETNSDEKP